MNRLGVYRLYAVLLVLYVVTVLIMPPSHITTQTYHLTSASYRVLLLLAIALPTFLTSLAAFYGYNQLEGYVKLIKDTKEGKAFHKLSVGCKWIALYVPVLALVGLILVAIANKIPDFRTASMLITSYLALAIAVVAFSAVSTGARLLADSADVRPSLRKTRLFTISFIVMSVLYCYFIVRHGLDQKASPYHMPIMGMLLTVVVPYFYSWMLGLLAVLDIDAYASKVSGVLYQRALRMLSLGILTVIGSSILSQYITSANTDRGRLVLGGLLVVRYLLYGGLAIGFILIAQSAKKLQQIEKI